MLHLEDRTSSESHPVRILPFVDRSLGLEVNGCSTLCEV